jgi:hypothetical protein
LHPALGGFARDAEIAEIFNFSFGVDPAGISGTGIPPKENHSAASLQKYHNSFSIYYYEVILKPIRLGDFSFSTSHRETKK